MSIKNRMIFALALTFTILCTSWIVSIDSSEGYVIVQDENDLYFKTDDPLTESEFKKLYSESSQESFAQSVLNAINVKNYGFNVTDISINSTSIEKSLASKTTSDSKKIVENSIVSMNISFKVTVSYGDSTAIFSSIPDGFLDLAKYMNNNKLDSNGYMYIKANVVFKSSSDSTYTYYKTQDGNFIPKSTGTRTLSNYTEIKSCKIDLKNGTDDIKNILISSNEYTKSRSNIDYTYEDDLTSSISSKSVAYEKISTDYYEFIKKYKLSFDNKNKEFELNQSYYYPYFLEYYGNTITTASVTSENIKADQLTYYQNNTGKCMFSSVGDSSLSNENALEAYLLTIGTLDSNYDKVINMANSIYGSETQNNDNMTLIIIIIAIVIIILIAAVIIIYLKKKKENETKLQNNTNLPHDEPPTEPVTEQIQPESIIDELEKKEQR